MTELKPCPFCNGKDVYVYGPFLVSGNCPKCGATGPACDTHEMAERAWNTRPKESALKQDLDALTFGSWSRELARLSHINSDLRAELKQALEYLTWMAHEAPLQDPFQEDEDYKRLDEIGAFLSKFKAD